MRNLFLILVFVLLAILPFGNGARFSLLEKSLTILSTQYDTAIRIEIIQENQSAQLLVNALGGSDPHSVSFDRSTLSIKSANTPEGSEVSASRTVNPLSAAWMLLAVASIGTFTMNGGLRTFCIVLAVVLAVSLSEARTEGSHEVVLQVPEYFVFDKLSIELEHGSVDLNLLEVNNLNINVKDGSVNFGSLGIFKSAIVNSNGAITVQALSLRSTKVLLDFVSQRDVDMNTEDYRGSVLLTHAETSVVNLIGDCKWTIRSGSRSGDCQSENTGNELRISAQGSIYLTTDSAEESRRKGVTTRAAGDTCPITYRDPEIVDQVPGSPSVSSTVPATSYLFGNFSRWFYRETSSGSMANLTQNGDEFVVTQSATLTNSDIFWLVCPECLPYLRTNVTYNFTLFFKQNASNPNLNNSNIISLELVLLKNIGWPSSYSLATNITNSTTKSMVVSSFPGLYNVTSYTKYTTSFSLSESLWSGYFAWDKRSSNTTNLNKQHLTLGIRVRLRQANVGAPTFYFKEFQLAKNAETFQTGTLLSSYSELIRLRKPSLISLPANRTGCPWNETGLLVWHDPATWGGILPDPSSVITLPNNTKVLITSCSLNATAVYNQIIVPQSSELIFSDAPINLSVQSIVVHGKLRIGSQTCRIYSKMTFTFVGASTTADVMGGFMGAKGLGVSATGSLDVHGKLYQYSWTRLRRTAWPGDDRVVIQDSVNWEVGQKVVVTTTILTDEWWNQNEVMEIKAISGNVVQFTEPLKFHHYGGKEYQAEVGLLSRRIVFQGDQQSEDESFGGHVIVKGEGRFSGVQAIRMGQKNRVARYPFHFHMMNEAPESFVQDCSCHHTYFRCVTVHGTNSSLVTRNVAFDVTGHCYYLEDGVEENNTFSYNLAVFVHVIGKPAAGPGQDGEFFKQAANLSQPADAAAAGFYITNAYNRYYGNAASGGWSGFSFPNLPLPVGVYAGVMMDPSGRPNLEFDSNTIHSTGYEWSSGSCIYTGGRLWISNTTTGELTYASGRYSRNTRIVGTGTQTYDAANFRWNGNFTKAWMNFNNTRSALCYAGMNHWGERLDISNYEGHDVGRGSTTFGESSVVNVLIEGQSANPITFLLDSQGFQFYDVNVKTILANAIFRNYQPRTPTPSYIYDDNYMLISMTHSDKFKPQGISATRNFTLVNVNRTMYLGHRVLDTGSSRYFNYVDWDGTASGSSGPSIVGSHSDWWYLNDTCRREWGVWVCPKPTDVEIANIIIYWNGNESQCDEPPHGTSIKIGNVSMWGDGISMVRSAPFTTCPGVTGVTGKGWYFWMPEGSPRNLSIYTVIIPNNQSVYLAVRYPNSTTFNITTDNKSGTLGDGPVTLASNWTDFKTSSGNKYFWNSDYLVLKLINKVIPSPPYFERAGVKLYTQQTNYRYIVRALNCGGSGFFCGPVTEQAPSWII